jgi:hypothetical protein
MVLAAVQKFNRFCHSCQNQVIFLHAAGAGVLWGFEGSVTSLLDLMDPAFIIKHQ